MDLTRYEGGAKLPLVSKGDGEGDRTATLDPRRSEQLELAGQTLPFAPASLGLSEKTSVYCLALDAGPSQAHGNRSVPLALDAFAWRQAGTLRLTVVAKATFSLSSSPLAPADAAVPIHAKDVHYRHQPVARVVAASDRAPTRPRVDVTLIGHAHAPDAKPVAEMEVRLAVVQQRKAVIDKTLRVVGERDSPDRAPAPFRELPIVYERAYGGIEIEANPVGRGVDDDRQPNVLLPGAPKAVAGFGPLAAVWQCRAKLVARPARKGLDAPIMELPDAIDWSYFQAAPHDQQLPKLEPDAVVVLEGLHPEEHRQRLALPRANARGAIYGLPSSDDPDAGLPLLFHADGVHLDTDQGLCTLTWRAFVVVPDEECLGDLLVTAGVTLGDQPLVVPAQKRALISVVEAATRAKQKDPSRRSYATLMLDPEQADAEVAAALEAADGSGTLDLHALAATAGTLPFGKQRGPVPPAPGMNATAALPEVDAPPPTAPSGEAAQRPAKTEFGEPALRPAELVGAMGRPAVPNPIRDAAEHLGVVEYQAYEPPASARHLFHDVSKLRNVQAPPEPEPEPDPEPEKRLLVLEQYATVAAELAEPGAQRRQVLEAHGVDATKWAKTQKHWRARLERAVERGQRGLRDRFDDAYVRSWDESHPGEFAIEHYGRLVVAEKQGRLSAAIAELDLPRALAQRLRRVWRRRVAADAELGKKLARLGDAIDSEDEE